MKEESQVEFQARWVKTAEADVLSARQKLLIWMIAFALTAVPYLAVQLAPARHRAIAVHLLLFVPFLISLVNMGVSASKLRESQKFLTECRQGAPTAKHSLI